jgi:hypothetical protein
MHTGKGDTAPALLGLRVYLQFMWEVGLPPHPVEFSSHCQFHKFLAPDYWVVLLLLLATMFVYSSRGKWVFPPLLWSFLTSATLTSFPTPGCWARAPTPARGSPARPACLFTVLGRVPFPQSQCTPPSFPHVFIVLIACYSVSLFSSWLGVSLSRGLCCSGPGLSVGVLRYREALLVRVFSSHLGTGDWWPRGPPGFSV